VCAFLRVSWGAPSWAPSGGGGGGGVRGERPSDGGLALSLPRRPRAVVPAAGGRGAGRSIATLNPGQGAARREQDRREGEGGKPSLCRQRPLPPPLAPLHAMLPPMRAAPARDCPGAGWPPPRTEGRDGEQKGAMIETRLSFARLSPLPSCSSFFLLFPLRARPCRSSPHPSARCCLRARAPRQGGRGKERSVEGLRSLPLSLSPLCVRATIGSGVASLFCKGGGARARVCVCVL
jgi:hypothetical protein